MQIIFGLGNPGEQYLNTRHNLGFEVLEELRRKMDGPHWSEESKFKAQVSKVSPDLLLVRPLTYMNQSGLAVSSIKNFYKVESENITVVHDELDLLLGHIKIRLGGGAGGHHGVESIIEKLGTDSFVRVRLGIGNDRSFSGEHKRISFNAEHFVLEAFPPQEAQTVKHLTKQAIKAIKILLKEGVEKAQNQFN